MLVYDNHVDWSSNGPLALINGSGYLEIFDLEVKQRPDKIIQLNYPTRYIKWNHSGTLVATVDNVDGSLTLIYNGKNEGILPFPGLYVKILIYSLHKYIMYKL